MDAMEEIWGKVAKPEKDGTKKIVLKGANDLGFLYVSGFVDIKKNSFKSWIDAFAPSRRKDGSYAVTHDQWVEKKKFRYTGRVGVPFDPMSIEEKQYTEVEVIKLLTEKIIPNTIYDESYIPQVLNNLRAQKKLVNGIATIDRKTKEYVAQIVNNYPSPTRILEILVDALRKSRGSKNAMSQLEAQKSGFAAGMTAQQIAASRLNEIAKEVKQAESQVANETPSVSLKDLKKKKRSPGRV